MAESEEAEEEFDHPLYAQTSAVAEYGIKPSQYDPENQEQLNPKWMQSQMKSQDLGSQLPKAPSTQNSIPESEQYTVKYVHEWTVTDVEGWFKSIASTLIPDEESFTKYILAFQQQNIDGKYLLTKINSKQTVSNVFSENLKFEPTPNKEIEKTIFKEIKKLKKRAKKEMNSLHPMKQSNLDDTLKSTYLKKTRISMMRNKESNGSILTQITENRFYRICVMSLLLILFCAIQMVDFLTTDSHAFGGIVAMTLFIIGNVIVLCLLFREKQSDYKVNTSQNKNVDNANLLAGYSDSAAESSESVSYRVTIGYLHVFAILCILFGSVTFVVSRWINMGSISLAEWLYGFGITLYIGSLCGLLLCDLIFLRLFDTHSTRMKGYHFINFVYYLMVIGYFAVASASILLGIIAILSSFVSLVVILIFFIPSFIEQFANSLLQRMLPGWIVALHIITMVVLTIEYKMKFFPVCNTPSVLGSIAFCILSTTLTVNLAIDAYISKTTPWYKL